MNKQRRILQPDERIDRTSLVLLVMAICAVVCSADLALRTYDRFYGENDEEQAVHARLDSLQCQIQQIRKPVSMRVRLTNYQSEAGQTDSTPHVTATNTRCRPGIVAVSRDLLEAGWAYGKRVYIEGFGVYTIEDVMAARHARSIDIWTQKKARTIDRTGVLAVLLEG